MRGGRREERVRFEDALQIRDGGRSRDAVDAGLGTKTRGSLRKNGRSASFVKRWIASSRTLGTPVDMLIHGMPFSRFNTECIEYVSDLRRGLPGLVLKNLVGWP